MESGRSTDKSTARQFRRRELEDTPLPIGNGCSNEIIDFAARELASAGRHADFDKYGDIAFPYEKLDGHNVDHVVCTVVDHWIGKEENIQRAADAVGRSNPGQTAEKKIAFCAFRFKELQKMWQVVHGLSVDGTKSSTVVIIALEPLNVENGCFVDLSKGEDVCIDGNADVFVPGRGRGLGIYMDLNI